LIASDFAPFHAVAKVLQEREGEALAKNFRHRSSCRRTRL
jgi:hypothetical protein